MDRPREATPLGRTMTLEHATCARLPAESLACLASLRRSGGVSVVFEGDRAWVRWEPGDDRVLRAVLPVEGVELYERRGDAWHRTGHRLPSFEAPPAEEPMPLARAVTPAPFSAEPPGGEAFRAVPLTLARDDRPRPTTAAAGPLAWLGRWAETARSGEISALRGVIRGDSALVLGRKLPVWPGSSRYWGGQLLVPIGHEIRPALPEMTLLEALGDPARELLRILPDESGDGLAVEAIPLEAFRPLTRAGIRLALVGATT